jgi:hypothetical protein
LYGAGYCKDSGGVVSDCSFGESKPWLAGVTLTGTGNLSDSSTTVYQAATEAPFQLWGTLWVHAGAGGTGPWGEGGYNQTGTAAGTATFFVTVLTPGVTLETASLHNYARVPEPSQTALPFAGLGLLGGWGWRQRAASAPVASGGSAGRRQIGPV